MTQEEKDEKVRYFAQLVIHAMSYVLRDGSRDYTNYQSAQDWMRKLDRIFNEIPEQE